MNTFKIMRIAKEDIKLAEEYFRLAMKRMLQGQAQQAQQSIQSNADMQQQSLVKKGEIDKDIMQTEMKMKGDLADSESKNKILELLITGFTNVMTKGIDVQPEWKPLETEVINNTLLPLFAKNLQNVGALGSAIQESQQKILQQQQVQQLMQQQIEQQNQQSNGQGQPQLNNQQPQPQQQAA